MKIIDCDTCKDTILAEHGWYELEIIPPHIDPSKIYRNVRHFCSWKCMKGWVE